MAPQLRHRTIDSPVGFLKLSARESGLYSLSFGADAPPEVQPDTPSDAQPDIPRDVDPGRPELHPAELLLSQAADQLRAYFAGERKHFDVKLHPEGTSFQLRVWNELRKIPFGQTRSYGQIAAALDSPKGQRAVGMANNRNPLSIVVPCDRVVGAKGELVGFGGGLPRKRWLLRHEGANWRLSKGGAGGTLPLFGADDIDF